MSIYEARYAHRMCHPETCCHEDDWQVTKDGQVVMYCESEEVANLHADLMACRDRCDEIGDEAERYAGETLELEARVKVVERALRTLVDACGNLDYESGWVSSAVDYAEEVLDEGGRDE